MSIVDQKTLFSQVMEKELVESRNDTYTPEQFELDGVDMLDQTNSFDKENYIETFELQVAMFDMCKECFKNRKIGKLLISAIAFLALALINAGLFIFGIFCIVLIDGFTPVSEDEVFRKKSIKGV